MCGSVVSRPRSPWERSGVTRQESGSAVAPFLRSGGRGHRLASVSHPAGSETLPLPALGPSPPVLWLTLRAPVPPAGLRRHCAPSSECKQASPTPPCCRVNLKCSLLIFFSFSSLPFSSSSVFLCSLFIYFQPHCLLGEQQA